MAAALAGVVPIVVAPGAFQKMAPKNGAVLPQRSLTIAWGPSARASSYRYCVDRSDDRRCGTRWVPTHATHAVLSDLLRGASYYWQVQAANARGVVSANGGTWFRFKIAPSAPTNPVPQAGAWTVALPATNGSGAPGSISITSADFTVSADHTAVVSFGFGYTFAGSPSKPGQSCNGAGSSFEHARSPIAKGGFATPSVTGSWTGAGSATFTGTFSSATRAQGTAQFQVFIGGTACLFSGSVTTSTVAWTAHVG